MRRINQLRDQLFVPLPTGTATAELQQPQQTVLRQRIMLARSAISTIQQQIGRAGEKRRIRRFFGVQ